MYVYRCWAILLCQVFLPVRLRVTIQNIEYEGSGTGKLYSDVLYAHTSWCMFGATPEH